MALKIEDNPDCWPPRGSFIGTLTPPLVGWGFLFSRSGLLEWRLRVLRQKVVLRGVMFNPIFWQRRRLWDIILTTKPVQNLRSNTGSPIVDIRVSTVLHKRTYRLQPRLPFRLWHANPELADILPIIPATISTVAIPSYTLGAPLIQINWQATDRPTSSAYHRTQQPCHQVYPQVRKQESELTFLSDKKYGPEGLLFKRPPKDPALGPVDETGAQNLLQTGERLANPDMGKYVQLTP